MALKYSECIKERDWDLVIFDEADILSKPDKMLTKVLKDSVREAYKLLLTPTPITMSIMDIYGLIHFIDESILPGADSFYKRYFRKPEKTGYRNFVSEHLRLKHVIMFHFLTAFLLRLIIR